MHLSAVNSWEISQIVGIFLKPNLGKFIEMGIYEDLALNMGIFEIASPTEFNAFGNF